ncbi:MAG TPA: hypothetical protein VM386_05305 [Acidimicrobiales bacterium]|nr:hypothetical protein [Acidimicrobiales bacterium]
MGAAGQQSTVDDDGGQRADAVLSGSFGANVMDVVHRDSARTAGQLLNQFHHGLAQRAPGREHLYLSVRHAVSSLLGLLEA